MISSQAIAQSVYELAHEGGHRNIADNLVKFLEQNNLLSLLDSVVAHLERMNIKDSEKSQLNLVSAHKMPEAMIKDIKQSLSAEKLGTVTENQELIGGFVAEYNGVVYDASVATQLSRLKNTLMS